MRTIEHTPKTEVVSPCMLNRSKKRIHVATTHTVRRESGLYLSLRQAG